MTTALEPPLLTGQPAYSYQITLEDAVVTLRYRFNGRLGAWFVELYTDTGEALAAPRRVIADDPLWAQFLYNPNVPQGMLTVLDKIGRASCRERV